MHSFHDLTSFQEEYPTARDSCSYECFSELLCQVFEFSPKGMEISEQLLTVKQGSRQVVEYALEFRTLATGSGWNGPVLQAVFH